jgi:hypothetical protein
MSERILPREMTPDERLYVEQWPEECVEGVIREGWEGPCEKPAVAVRVDPVDGGVYPVCAYHARGQMVALRDVLGLDLGKRDVTEEEA